MADLNVTIRGAAVANAVEASEKQGGSSQQAEQAGGHKRALTPEAEESAAENEDDDGQPDSDEQDGAELEPQETISEPEDDDEPGNNVRVSVEDASANPNVGRHTPQAYSYSPPPPPPMDEETWEEKRNKLPKVAEVKWYNSFERFKNRYSENEGFEIIEVLRGNHNTVREVAEERSRRKGWKKKRDPEVLPGAGDGEGSWMQRVRIQSPSLLFLLAHISANGNGWSLETPRVFFRPFRALYQYQPRMKESLRVLKLRLKDELQRQRSKTQSQTNLSQDNIQRHHSEAVERRPGRTPEPGENEDSDSEDDYKDGDDVDDEDDIAGDIVDLEDGLPEIAGDTATAVKHLQVYIQFVEDHIMPMYKHFSGVTQRKVRFYDLWMVFQPGEIFFASSVSDSPKFSNAGTAGKPKSESEGLKDHQALWRMYAMSYGHYDLLEKPDRQEIELSCYYIDYNGTSYGPVKKNFKIPYYEGEKDIASLNVYPMRFVKDYEGMKKALATQGEQFQTTVTQKHFFYDGWTPTHNPAGDADAEHKNPEHVEGDVIIDFVEGFKAHPTRKPAFDDLIRFDDWDWPSREDRLLIKHWSDPQRTSLLGQIEEKAQINEWFCGFQEKFHRRTNKFMIEWENGKVDKLEGDDLLLLPRRLMAYALRERRFVMVDIQSLRPVVSQDNVFRDLKIDENHKRMVKSLVKAHFKKQEYQKVQPTTDLNQDIIRGKGSGLVILLHGVPGVGKTATAEAVAQANKKPLFVITCGDLGFTPNAVENTLKDIFRLAHLWECVLLLDEADIFLSRRETSDLKRNALVSVFLRVLEYYSGILFLTTNRVGTLDEAFKSRIHVSLYYPPLSIKQTLAIFDLNIRRLQAIEDEKRSQAQKLGHARPEWHINAESIMDFARWHFTNTASQRWNGRQIRNAFQIASSLADFDMEKTSLDFWEEEEILDAEGESMPAPNPRLDYRQFNVVADAIEEFDNYLTEASGGVDEDYARNMGIRADDFDPRQTPDRKMRYQPPRSAQYLRPVRRNSGQGGFQDPPRSPARGPSQRGNQGGGARRGPPPQGRSGAQSDRYQPGPPRNKYQPPRSPQGANLGTPSSTRGGARSSRSPANLRGQSGPSQGQGRRERPANVSRQIDGGYGTQDAGMGHEEEDYVEESVERDDGYDSRDGGGRTRYVDEEDEYDEDEEGYRDDYRN